MATKLLKGATIFNEGKSFVGDVLIKNERIEKIATSIAATPDMEVIALDGKWLLPGCIDDQVHFREPGLTHKGNIQSESRAAVAGGITSFMEMPNTVPNALTQELLQDKYDIASKNSPANYSFFMGASNDNLEHVLKTDGKNVCGVKIFMGSSTGNMLVDRSETLEKLFSNVPLLIATHCEDEATIRRNTEIYKEKYGEHVPMEMHPLIRSAEACYLSSSFAVSLAKKHNTRLHILHISTGIEVDLFDNTIPLEQKRITSEACVHHLWFNDQDYQTKGTLIKWNPAVKTENDRLAIWEGLLSNKIDIVATDHAPHTIAEKNGTYFNAPSGGPLVQHALLAMLEKAKEGVISVERVVEKMAHAPAICFQLAERGFIREGYFADLVVVDPSNHETVEKSNIRYSCGWSPFEGTTFSHKIAATYVNGNMVYDGQNVRTDLFGKRLTFNR
ncbi:MAG: dihydroorotase [Crocinitomicaceae bacterium]|nr:MAG: dihydroorotase [Crocinitomicaceae bacterium]